jgi:hypothetical protein
LKKRRVWNFEASYGRSDDGVYHLVLPRFHEADKRTFRPREPDHVKMLDDRLALTWTFCGSLSVRFTYRKLPVAKFRKVRAAGVPVHMAVSPGAKQFLKDTVASIKEEGKDVAGKALAELLKVPGGPR